MLFHGLWNFMEYIQWNNEIYNISRRGRWKVLRPFGPTCLDPTGPRSTLGPKGTKTIGKPWENGDLSEKNWDFP